MYTLLKVGCFRLWLRRGQSGSKERLELGSCPRIWKHGRSHEDTRQKTSLPSRAQHPLASFAEAQENIDICTALWDRNNHSPFLVVRAFVASPTDPLRRAVLLSWGPPSLPTWIRPRRRCIVALCASGKYGNISCWLVCYDSTRKVVYTTSCTGAVSGVRSTWDCSDEKCRTIHAKRQQKTVPSRDCVRVSFARDMHAMFSQEKGRGRRPSPVPDPRLSNSSDPTEDLRFCLFRRSQVMPSENSYADRRLV